ncbi:MAG: DUF177 domain-containing protein [Myxococcota bacterium]|nr:DUF177 domain-containing protein [Myxococcota bacterium]
MKLEVDRVTGTPDALHFPVTAGWWERHCAADAELAAAFAEPLALDLRVHTMGEDLYLEGEVRGELALTCARCATRYREPVRESFRLVLEPAGSRVPADPEGAEGLDRDGLYLSDELEHGWYRGSEIHLDRFVKELVALGVPVQPLCREDCRGLCPRCGIDRNEARCGCVEEVRHSPFAALRALRDSGPGTGGRS